ncbi:MAG: methyltransferase domain-containing protein [Cyclobacteriaceae bacterium]|nr:methyltransferase domain-containing protein [Cyclobacteriaceae bacterium]
MDTNRIKLNLGCGSVRPEGWINTDSSLNASIQKIPLVGKKISRLFNPVEYESGNFQYMNLNKPWSFKSNSVDVVYASHLFEHLTLKSAELFVNEAYRCLKPGGVVRIVVPDLYQIARKYIAEYDSDDTSFETTKFIMWAINMHREGQYGNIGLFKKIILEEQGYPHQHKFMYDPKSLRQRFSRFEEPLNLSYGVSTYIPEINDVEGKEESYLSVYFEAKKPS